MIKFRIDINFVIPSDVFLGNKSRSIWRDTPKECIEDAKNEAQELSMDCQILGFHYVIEHHSGNIIQMQHVPKREFLRLHKQN